MEKSKLSLGLILDPEFYILKKSVTAITNYLVKYMIQRFETRILYSQDMYDKYCNQVDFLLSLEPVWASPVLNWKRKGIIRKTLPDCPTFVQMSDPHKNKWREDYFLKQGLDYILALYLNPTYYHFRKVSKEKIIHFPWSIPDEWIQVEEEIAPRNQKYLMLFGGSKSDAYEVRNWCRNRPGVKSFSHSGVENKLVSNEEYIGWLSQFDAVIAAGSEAPKYRLTTPKYFEILAAGGLLFAQVTDDLPHLGFIDGKNCIIFHRGNFDELKDEYLSDIDNRKWLEIRRNGKQLISQRHTISNRLNQLEDMVLNWSGR